MQHRSVAGAPSVLYWYAAAPLTHRGEARGWRGAGAWVVRDGASAAPIAHQDDILFSTLGPASSYMRSVCRGAWSSALTATAAQTHVVCPVCSSDLDSQSCRALSLNVPWFPRKVEVEGEKRQKSTSRKLVSSLSPPWPLI